MPGHGPGRAPLLWLVLPVLCGLWASALLPLTDETTLWPALACAVAAAASIAALLFRSRRRWGLWAAAAGLCIGACLHALGGRWAASWSELPPREAVLQVRIVRVFAGGAADGRCSGIAEVAGAPAHLRPLAGRSIHFSGRQARGSGPVRRGGLAEAAGVLELLPREAAPGSFEHYLRCSGVSFSLLQAQMQALPGTQPAFAAFCDRANAWLAEALGAGVRDHPAELGAYRAMLLGSKHELSVGQKQLFVESGTMHLFAISGLHIGLLALALNALLLLVRVPSRIAACLCLAALLVYVEATGGAPSARRAWLMAAFLIASRETRLPGSALAALAAAAAASLVINPLDAFSAGYQMSYGIVFAILVWGVPASEKITRLWRPFRDVTEEDLWREQDWMRRAWRWAAQALGVGLAATCVSLFTGVTCFGMFTPGALFVNLVMVSLSLVVLSAGLAAMLSSAALLAPLASLFNHAGLLVIAVMERLIALMLRTPGGFMEAGWRHPWLGNTGLLILLGLMLAGAAGRWRGRLRIWHPPAFALLWLLAFLRLA